MTDHYTHYRVQDSGDEILVLCPLTKRETPTKANYWPYVEATVAVIAWTVGLAYEMGRRSVCDAGSILRAGYERAREARRGVSA